MRVLMVCLGNICRSPLAQGILESKVAKLGLDWEVDSAGTSSWHIGEGPDKRSVATANNYGIDISNQKARQFVTEDFSSYDLILAMDSSNYQDILSSSVNKAHESKVKLILNYIWPAENRAVPDPYWDGNFEKVYSLLNTACDKLIAEHSVK